jgi:hypothetical protein
MSPAKTQNGSDIITQHELIEAKVFDDLARPENLRMISRRLTGAPIEDGEYTLNPFYFDPGPLVIKKSELEGERLSLHLRLERYMEGARLAILESRDSSDTHSRQAMFLRFRSDSRRVRLLAWAAFREYCVLARVDRNWSADAPTLCRHRVNMALANFTYQLAGACLGLGFFTLAERCLRNAEADMRAVVSAI